ncbi:LysR family transcriptional regulator [Derxia gummosa]|uniref:LysR family transcriptional regulator n=1 Tax=Derxia gummosa DSM 723 TaxID=1121388 RepID=A0A8B6XB85_9BURK|nr:LysR family transcriptional regulator [Derxia gummosa]
MSSKRIDLNLLRVFEAVMQRRSIAGASRELHLTPSAVSHALARLREAIGDPLFVTSGRGMEPTTRALDLAPRLRAGLAQLDEALDIGGFDPASATRDFRIAATDYACTMLLAPLVRRIAARAPGVDLRVFPFSRLDTIRQLDDGRLDLVLGWFDELPARMRRLALWEDREALVVRAGHPLARGPVSREALLRFPHVVVELTGSAESGPGGFFDDRGVQRRVWIERLLLEGGIDGAAHGGRAAVSVPHYGAVLPLVETSDLVATLPLGYVRATARPGAIALLDLPYEPVVARIEALWHRRSDPDAGVSWLVGELAAGAAEAVGMSAARHAVAAGTAAVEAPPAGQAQTGE